MDDAPIISTGDLANLIDQCIGDMRNGGGGRLGGVMSVMEAMAECGESPYIHVFPQAIFGFSTELARARGLADTSMPDHMLKSHKKLLDSASEQGIKALAIIKGQLCGGQKIDYEELIKAAGLLFQQSSILSSGMSQFERAKDDE